MRNLLVIISIVTGSISFGQIESARKFTQQLCSPDFHGRGYVNKGDSIAAAYIAEEFKKNGAQPIGGSYYQYFTLGVNTFPSRISVVQSGKELEPGKDFVVSPTSGGGIMSLSPYQMPKDKVLDIDFIKSILVQISSDADINSILFDLSELSADTLRNVSGLANELANILPVIELIDGKFTWSVGRSQNKHPHIQIKKNKLVSEEHKFEVEIDAEFIENYQSQNVIARIPGKKKCNKTIVFTAHYDHLGRMGNETYFPGANDNASGTAMLTYLANHFKNNPVDHEIVLIAFAGEEAGLVGSKYFVENPLIKLKKIDFMLNLDIMGSGEEGITVVNATLFEEAFNKLNSINDNKELLHQIKRRGPAANSDHYWFTEEGVPSFFIYTMGPNKHYHDVFDTYDELSFNEFEDIATLLIEFVNELEE